MRLQKAGLVVKIMQQFINWELWRGRGLLRLSRFIIAIYGHVARTASGRKSMVKCDAILQIRRFCESCPSERAFDDVIMRVAGLVSTCYLKDALPVDSLDSPIVFKLPDSGRFRKCQDSGSSSDDEGSEDEASDDSNDDSDEGSASAEEHEGDAENSTSDDDDVDIINGNLQKISSNASRRSINGDKLTLTQKTDKLAQDSDELYNYEKFFQEFDNFGRRLLNRNLYKPNTPMSSSLASLGTNSSDDNESKKSSKCSLKSEHKYPWIIDNKDCKYAYWTSIEEMRQNYITVANSINHVSPFIKIPYPELAFAYSYKTVENMLPTADRSMLRNKMILYISRTVGGDSFKPKTAYSLDVLLKKTEQSSPGEEKDKELKNSDEKQVGKYNKNLGLQFESRFESGNLRKVIQVI